MIQWKQRMYAFLLRRALGPYLTSESLVQLHDCIDVSLQEGKFTLRNVHLNLDVLNRKLASGPGGPVVAFRRAHVAKLEIVLTLVEHGGGGGGGDDESSSRRGTPALAPSSIAWRAMQFGSTPGEKVSLVASVTIDGLHVDISPCQEVTDALEVNETTSQTDVQHAAVEGEEEVSPASTAAVMGSMVSSYLDAAMASLRLSVRLANLHVRVHEGGSSAASGEWLEMRLLSASYRDGAVVEAERPPRHDGSEGCFRPSPSEAPRPSSRQICTTLVNKVVEFTRITVVVGNDSKSTSTIALLDGSSPGKVALRVVEYIDSASPLGEPSSTHPSLSPPKRLRKVQQDVQVHLRQRLNVSVDETSLVQVYSIVRSLLAASRASLCESTVEPAAEGASTVGSRNDDNTTSADTVDLRTMHGIMNEYQKARLLAEQNQFRGGILLPSVDDDAENDINARDDLPVTFEAFFDANDHSFGRLSTILRESVIMEGIDGAAGSPLATFVHTKLNLHLADACLKVSFGESQGTGGLRRRPADEYLLLSLTEVTATSSIAQSRSEHALSIALIDLEDSQIIEDDRSGRADTTARSVDIGTILKFLPVLSEVGDSLESQSGLIVAPPCLTVSFRTDFDGERFSSEMDITLEPMELTFRDRTIANAAVLAESLLSKRSDGAESPYDTIENVRSRTYVVFLSCPELTIYLPVHFDSAWITLYNRRGYLTDAWVSRSSLCISLDVLAVEASNRVDAPAVDITFHSATPFVQSPNDAVDGTAFRFDVGSVSGRTDFDPAVGVNIKLWMSESDDSKAAELFPKVPAIKSFKARQEDEDEDNRVDQVFSSYEKEFDIGPSRSSLKGIDPQAEMLCAVSESTSAIEIHIPEILADLSRDELFILSAMSVYLKPNASLHRPSKASTPPRVVSMAVTSDLLLLEIIDTTRKDGPESTVRFQMEIVQLHLLRQGTFLRQMRLLTHDLGLVLVPRPRSESTSATPFSARSTFRHRMQRVASSPPSILLHRTSLFPTISYQSPVFLLDLIDSSTDEDHKDPLKKKNLYVTVYDLTYRFDNDISTLDRVQSVLEPFRGRGAQECASGQTDQRVTFQVTRLFFTLVDCNCDYSSSVAFATPSRLILRIGDARVSSNILTPLPAVQAISASVGDAVLYVAKSKFPYSYENSQFNWHFMSHASVVPCTSEAIAVERNEGGDSIQRAMGLTTVAILDSLDTVVTSTQPPYTTDPKVQATLTIGELGVFAAKDSFAKVVSAVSELATRLTALDARALEELRSNYATSLDAEETSSGCAENDTDATFHTLEDLKRQSALRPTAGTSRSTDEVNDFLLDGYDWTTIDQGSHRSFGVPSGEEQSARWYAESPSLIQTSTTTGRKEIEEEVAFLPAFVTPEALSSSPKGQGGPQIISQHFPFHLASDPLIDKETDLAKFAGTLSQPTVGMRVIVHDFRFKIRLFDGYDWPDLLDKSRRPRLGKGAFVIDEVCPPNQQEQQSIGEAITKKPSALGRKSALMDELLSSPTTAKSDTFRDAPLPEERGAQLRDQAEFQRLQRRPGRYFQVSGSGVSLRVDSLLESSDHRLASVLKLKVQDFFLAETISSDRPIKFAGEWVNELEHPRDSKDGLLTVKMATWHPTTRVTPNNEIVNDEAEIAFRMLPLRCMIDQKAVRFIRAYFRSDGIGPPSEPGESIVRGGKSSSSTPSALSSPTLYSIPPPLFRSFRFLQFKLKVDYRPEKLDAAAIYNGALVELINLSPIDGLVLTLQQVRGENQVGYGAVVSAVVSHWLQDVCSTQLHKFVTSARAVDPFANVGSAAVDLIVLPWEAIQNGESVRRALRAGTTALAATVVTESLNVGSRLSKFMADQVARRATPSLGMNVLPSRPLDAPRDLRDAAPHMLETLTRGLQAANYTVVIVPYREYRRRGATGALTSALRGIPVAIAAPASGAAEAFSYAAIGVRNQVRPDLRREDEAAMRGLHSPDAYGRR